MDSDAQREEEARRQRYGLMMDRFSDNCQLTIRQQPESAKVVPRGKDRGMLLKFLLAVDTVDGRLILILKSQTVNQSILRQSCSLTCMMSTTMSGESAVFDP